MEYILKTITTKKGTSYNRVIVPTTIQGEYKTRLDRNKELKTPNAIFKALYNSDYPINFQGETKKRISELLELRNIHRETFISYCKLVSDEKGKNLSQLEIIGLYDQYKKDYIK